MRLWWLLVGWVGLVVSIDCGVGWLCRVFFMDLVGCCVGIVKID